MDDPFRVSVPTNFFDWLASETASPTLCRSTHHIILLCCAAWLSSIMYHLSRRSEACILSLSLCISWKLKAVVVFRRAHLRRNGNRFLLLFLCVPLPSVWASSYVCVRFTVPYDRILLFLVQLDYCKGKPGFYCLITLKNLPPILYHFIPPCFAN